MSQTDAPTDPVVGAIEHFLEQALAELEPQESAAAGPGRPRILPALCLWGALLVGVLRGQPGQRALWRRITQVGLWLYPRFPVSDQAVANRLAAAGTAPLENLFAQIRTVLAARLAPYAQHHLAPFASAVLALDSTSLDPVARTLPALRGLPDGDVRLRLGKLAALFDLRHQQWWRVVHIANPHENDKVQARSVLAGVPRGALILMDLGFFAFAWFDWLTEQSLFFISRVREKTTYTVIHTFYAQGTTRDGLVFLGAYRSDRGEHAVRLVEFQVGAATYRYLTNVLDPTVLSIADIAALYARRWDIERAFQLIKQHLGLGLLWSGKEVLVLQQVWAVLIISQILQALQLEIAGRAGVDPFEVSLPLLVQYAPQLAYEGHDLVEWVVEHGRAAGFIRPSRRTRTHAPRITAAAYVPVPADRVLHRPPRHSQRKCGPRSSHPAPV